jgi:hypothetical protein
MDEELLDSDQAEHIQLRTLELAIALCEMANSITTKNVAFLADQFGAQHHIDYFPAAAIDLLLAEERLNNATLGANRTAEKRIVFLLHLKRSLAFRASLKAKL